MADLQFTIQTVFQVPEAEEGGPGKISCALQKASVSYTFSKQYHYHSPPYGSCLILSDFSYFRKWHRRRYRKGAFSSIPLSHPSGSIAGIFICLLLAEAQGSY